MNAEERLFASGDLYQTLQAQQRRAHQAVLDWNPDQLLATAEADVIDYLVAEYSVACPVLHRDRIESLGTYEDSVTARDMFSYETYQHRITKFAIAVPFDGEENVFKLRPSQSGLSTPAAQVKKGELQLTWTQDPQVPHDPDAVRRHFDGQLDRIEQHLGWARTDVDRHNAAVRGASVPPSPSGRRSCWATASWRQDSVSPSENGPTRPCTRSR